MILRAAGLLHPLRGSPLPEGAKDAAPPKTNTPTNPNLNVGEFEMFKLGFVERFEDFKFGFVGVLVETEQPPCGTLLVGTGVLDGPFTDGL